MAPRRAKHGGTDDLTRVPEERPTLFDAPAR
jgi:hypothetical protein